MKGAKAVDTVKLELAVPKYRFGKSDRTNFGKPAVDPGTDGHGQVLTEVLARVRVSIRIMQGLVAARYPRMDAKDSRVWATFLDLFSDEPEEIEVTRPQFDWLYKIITAEDLQFDPAAAHWRVAFEDYIQDVRDALRTEDKVKA